MTDRTQTERHHTLLGSVHAYGSVCFFVFGIIYWIYVSSLYMLVSNFLFGALCALNWALHRKLGRVGLFTATFLVIVYVGLVNVVVTLGARDSPLVYWGLSVLTAAAFIYALRGLVVWVALSLAFYPITLYLKRGPLAFRAIPLDEGQIAILTAASYFGIGLFIGYSVLLFQRKLTRALVALEEKTEALETAHGELEARVAARTAELSKANRELRESERLVAAVLENLPDMVYLKTADTLQYVRVNRASEQFLGQPREALLGKTDDDLFPPDRAARFRAHDHATLASEGVVEVPAEPVDTAPQGERVLRTKKVTVLDEEHRPRFLLGISEDVTDRVALERERKALEARIQQAQKLESLGVLAGGIAHDFNNLLAVILGNLELAAQKAPKEAALARHLKAALVGVRRANDLVGQMLAYAGKGRKSTGDIDLPLLVGEMCDLLQTSLPKSVTLSFHHAEALPKARGDATQIRQVVMNLLTNASEAMGDRPGTIDVSAERVHLDSAELDRIRPDEQIPAGEYLRLRISDSGPGLSPDVLPRIFEPFYTTKAKGSGLGLAVVHGIVKDHRGAVTVESQSGQGTTVTVLLPAVIQTSAAATEKAPAGEWPCTGVVLVVDDEELVRLFAQDALKGFGFEVLTAPDGAEALALFRARADALVAVLLDSRMPGMSGEETFHAMRALREEVPVILCSGFVDEEATTELAIHGLAGFLQKPYTIEALERMLRAVLSDREPEDLDSDQSS